jgi:hypothetical protein
MEKAHSNFESVPPLPEVDFSQRMIIAVSYEYLPDPSHTISITKLLRTPDGLKTVIKETIRGGQFCGAVPAVTVWPLHIIEAELTEAKLIKKAQFELEQQIVDCQPPN